MLLREKTLASHVFHPNIHGYIKLGKPGNVNVLYAHISLSLMSRRYEKLTKLLLTTAAVATSEKTKLFGKFSARVCGARLDIAHK